MVNGTVRLTPWEYLQVWCIVPVIERLPQFKQGHFYRCVNDGCGRLVGQKDIASGTCLGHKMKIASRIKFTEFVSILMGWIG